MIWDLLYDCSQLASFGTVGDPNSWGWQDLLLSSCSHRTFPCGLLLELISGCCWHGGLRVTRLLTWWLETSRMNVLLTLPRSHSVTSITSLPSVKGRGCRNHFSMGGVSKLLHRKITWDGQYYFAHLGKHNCDTKSGFFSLASFLRFLLEGSRPHVFVNFNHFYVKDSSPNGTSYLYPFLICGDVCCPMSKGLTEDEDCRLYLLREELDRVI